MYTLGGKFAHTWGYFCSHLHFLYKSYNSDQIAYTELFLKVIHTPLIVLEIVFENKAIKEFFSFLQFHL